MKWTKWYLSKSSHEHKSIIILKLLAILNLKSIIGYNIVFLMTTSSLNILPSMICLKIINDNLQKIIWIFYIKINHGSYILMEVIKCGI